MTLNHRAGTSARSIITGYLQKIERGGRECESGSGSV